MNSTEFWKEECKKAFNGDTQSNDFVLFFEGCKTLSEDGLEYIWKTTEYENKLELLDCSKQEAGIWSLPLASYTTLANLKSEIRSQWHHERQKELRQHLKEILNQAITMPTDMTTEQRTAHMHEFIKEHETDLGAVPFMRGLAGFLRYQLDNKSFLVEWKMSEYVLSQNNEEAMESYIRLLASILGLQLVYQDDDNNDTVIQMHPEQPQDDETTYIWRMNPDLDTAFIQQTLKSLSKHTSSTTTNEYRVTDIPRNTKEPQGLFEWLFYLISQCLSFIHK